MRCFGAWTAIAVLTLFSISALASERVLGPFSSEIGQLRIELSDGTASVPGMLRIQLETDARKQLWSTIYSSQSDDVVYGFPLSPDESSFLITENLGSGYRTVILHVESQQSVVTQLDASGKGFAEVIRAGVEDTRFVIIPNSSKAGDVVDSADIYAFQDGIYRFQQKVAYGQALSAVQQLSRKIDQAAAERRKGVVVHP